jgi:mannose-6-phosphate isomerase-like protein (cupin superfamily)
MKIIQRKSQDIPKEEAHGGSGARKVYASSEFTKGQNLEAVTHGYLPAGATFEWHDHKDTEEVMVVLKGSGTVADDDGEYDYAQGDVYIFPPNIKHQIHNPSGEEHEMLFVRVKA